MHSILIRFLRYGDRTRFHQKGGVEYVMFAIGEIEIAT